MKKHEIHINTAYTDGKGNVRLVTGEGPQFVLYPEQADTDCVQYRELARRGKPVAGGKLHSITRFRFAAWARVVVEEVAP